MSLFCLHCVLIEVLLIVKKKMIRNITVFNIQVSLGEHKRLQILKQKKSYQP